MSKLRSGVKRFLTGLLSAAMIATSVPAYTFAAELPENEEEAVVLASETEEDEAVEQAEDTSYEEDETTEDEAVSEDAEPVQIKTSYAGNYVGTPSSHKVAFNISDEYEKNEACFTVYPRDGITKVGNEWRIDEGASTFAFVLVPDEHYRIPSGTVVAKTGTNEEPYCFEGTSVETGHEEEYTDEENFWRVIRKDIYSPDYGVETHRIPFDDDVEITFNCFHIEHNITFNYDNESQVDIKRGTYDYQSFFDSLDSGTPYAFEEGEVEFSVRAYQWGYMPVVMLGDDEIEPAEVHKYTDPTSGLTREEYDCKYVFDLEDDVTFTVTSEPIEYSIKTEIENTEKLRDKNAGDVEAEIKWSNDEENVNKSPDANGMIKTGPVDFYITVTPKTKGWYCSGLRIYRDVPDEFYGEYWTLYDDEATNGVYHLYGMGLPIPRIVAEMRCKPLPVVHCEYTEGDLIHNTNTTSKIEFFSGVSGYQKIIPNTDIKFIIRPVEGKTVKDVKVRYGDGAPEDDVVFLGDRKDGSVWALAGEEIQEKLIDAWDAGDDITLEIETADEEASLSFVEQDGVEFHEFIPAVIDDATNRATSDEVVGEKITAPVKKHTEAIIPLPSPWMPRALSIMNWIKSL